MLYGAKLVYTYYVCDVSGLFLSPLTNRSRLGTVDVYVCGCKGETHGLETTRERERELPSYICVYVSYVRSYVCIYVMYLSIPQLISVWLSIVLYVCIVFR